LISKQLLYCTAKILLDGRSSPFKRAVEVDVTEDSLSSPVIDSNSRNTSREFRAEHSAFQISKRMFIVALAVTIHNFPEGLALGMAFGGIGEHGTKLKDAIILTLALGMQNLPEGFAISVPIWKSGTQKLTSFCYGQFSGSVEVLGALLGAYLVMTVEAVLPYSLSFAAGSMIYVVCKELIPASKPQSQPMGLLGIFVGFTLMMVLDVGFE